MKSKSDLKNITEPELLPDYEDYQYKINYNFPISIDGLDDIISYILLHSDLNREQIEAIVREFFHVIRYILLQGGLIKFARFGTLLLNCPRNNTKQRIFVKFHLYRPLFKKMNNRS